MLQRLLDTVSFTGGQWVVVIAMSLVSPAVVGIDKAIRLHREKTDSLSTQWQMTGDARAGTAAADGTAP